MNKVVMRLSIVCGAACVVLMLARSIPVYAPWLENGMSVVAYPLIMCRHACAQPVNHLCSLVRARTDAERARCDYQDRYEQLVAQQVENAGIEATWQETKELVEFKKRYAHETALVVHIIGRHFFSDRHMFVIDAGSAKGVQVDMVAVYKNCLVGRVSEVYPYYSCVTLVTDPQCKVAAFCKKALDRGIHEGCCTLDTMRLTYIFDVNLDLEKRLEKGDVIISSGEGLIFPRGFGLGTVVDYQKNDVQYTITVKPFLDFSRLEYCSLIAKGAEYIGSDDYVGNAPVNNAPVIKQDMPEMEKKKMVPSAAHQAVKTREAKQDIPEIGPKKVLMPRVKASSETAAQPKILSEPEKQTTDQDKNMVVPEEAKAQTSELIPEKITGESVPEKAAVENSVIPVPAEPIDAAPMIEASSPIINEAVDSSATPLVPVENDSHDVKE